MITNKTRVKDGSSIMRYNLRMTWRAGEAGVVNCPGPNKGAPAYSALNPGAPGKKIWGLLLCGDHPSQNAKKY
ncbi:hypothetical protein [Pseudoduganella guangdongensis]|uniref:hypothetical protein n=1 Tax=Pseudoduganella guangdongensis TaxID=2692179 RepID=UPI001926CA17|nr:hypothetical protein [Pseudoduganella guangdongensis]